MNSNNTLVNLCSALSFQYFGQCSSTLATWCEELTIGKDPNAGQDWRQEEKGTTEDKMVEWHRWLDGHEFEQTPGLGDGQGSLECCSPWGCKEPDTTEQLNWTDKGGNGGTGFWNALLLKFSVSQFSHSVMSGTQEFFAPKILRSTVVGGVV